jgi:hypothetical protein
MSSRLNQGKETGRRQGMQVLTKISKQTNNQKRICGWKINEDETEFMVLEKNEENKIINLLN